MFGSQWVNGQRVAINASSAYANELRKWESQFTQWGPPGRPYVHQDYPAMMYKASRADAGVKYENIIATDEDHRSRLEALGWVYGSGLDALKRLELQEFEMAQAAAERAYSDRKMSARAQAEADAKDSQTIQHLGELPETPIKRMVKREDK